MCLIRLPADNDPSYLRSISSGTCLQPLDQAGFVSMNPSIHLKLRVNQSFRMSRRGKKFRFGQNTFPQPSKTDCHSLDFDLTACPKSLDRLTYGSSLLSPSSHHEGYLSTQHVGMFWRTTRNAMPANSAIFLGPDICPALICQRGVIWNTNLLNPRPLVLRIRLHRPAA